MWGRQMEITPESNLSVHYKNEDTFHNNNHQLFFDPIQ